MGCFIIFPYFSLSLLSYNYKHEHYTCIQLSFDWPERSFLGGGVGWGWGSLYLSMSGGGGGPGGGGGGPGRQTDLGHLVGCPSAYLIVSVLGGASRASLTSALKATQLKGDRKTNNKQQH